MAESRVEGRLAAWWAALWLCLEAWQGCLPISGCFAGGFSGNFQEKSVPWNAAHWNRQNTKYQILICREPAVGRNINSTRDSVTKKLDHNRDWRQGSFNRYFCNAFRLFRGEPGLSCSGKRTLILREVFLYARSGKRYNNNGFYTFLPNR